MGESLLSWLLILEIVFPLLLLSTVLIVVLMRNKSRFKDAMRELIINVKDNEPIQKEATQRFLHENLGFEEGDVEKISNDIIRERKFFIRTFVSSILNKDVENLATLDDELSRIMEKYHALEPTLGSGSDDDELEEKADALRSELEAKETKIEELRQENKSLKQEIHITLGTLNSIFTEYSSMFGEEIPQTNMSVEQIIKAMESFSGSSDSLVSDEPTEEPTDVSPQVETETAADLELDDEPEEKKNDGSSSLLDDMPLEDIGNGDDEDEEDEEEPSWEDAFSESGDKMEKDPD
ncbi:hypothetical protein [Pleionea sediminis]|uniref:hypothetical protein n=1 Tax=Pleionea sediminis TaxID=2569479 RepID=UPI0011852C7D|nr:hypothetical protein [Pleionea sediminis]